MGKIIDFHQKGGADGFPESESSPDEGHLLRHGFIERERIVLWGAKLAGSPPPYPEIPDFRYMDL